MLSLALCSPKTSTCVFPLAQHKTKFDIHIKPNIPVYVVYFNLRISAEDTLLLKLSLAGNLVLWHRITEPYVRGFRSDTTSCRHVACDTALYKIHMFQWLVPEWPFAVPCFRPLSRPCLVTTGVFSPLVWGSWGWESHVTMTQDTFGAFM
jgi:hypothetical protein